VVFRPGKINGGKYHVDTGTAGSVTLVLQALVPVCLYADAPCEIGVKGGTAVPYSPTTEYFQHVFCDFLGKMGITIGLETIRHGFYPAGGGEVILKTQPARPLPLNIVERGTHEKTDVKAIASDHLREAKVAERLIMGFQQVYPHAHFKYKYVDARSPGCFIRSHAHFTGSKLGADALGRKGKRAEDVGKEAAGELVKAIASDAAVDGWMTDQLIPYLALAVSERRQPCAVKIPGLSLHAETNIWVTKQFLPVDFDIKDNILKCRRAGSDTT
jgi:RNA 3'-phosphate cyclase